LVFGAFIDVPLIAGGFIIMYRYRDRLAFSILRVKLPPLALYLLLSIPLIIFEEQINCMPAWCGGVIIPPTLPFIFVEMAVLGGIVLLVHAKNTLRVTTVFSIFGLFWEIFLGGLVGASLVAVAIIGPYVAISYAFISLLPLSILAKRESSVKGGTTSLATGGAPLRCLPA
jgi:hypothetical protein